MDIDDISNDPKIDIIIRKATDLSLRQNLESIQEETVDKHGENYKTGMI